MSAKMTADTPSAYVDLLRRIGQGGLVGDIDQVLADLVAACEHLQQDGSITVTVTFKFLEDFGAWVIVPKVAAKVPMPNRDTRVYLHKGQVRSDDPHQVGIDGKVAELAESLR
jgi:hypothetical protein